MLIAAAVAMAFVAEIKDHIIVGDKMLVDSHVRRLASPRAWEREAAAIALGALGAKAESAMPSLLGALNDKDMRVREAALVAIDMIDPSMINKLLRPVSGREPSR
jgi:HEAT repeat protein